MTREIKALPIGISIFSNIRERNYLYIDKTHNLQNLIMQGECYFLARPRRFGKSLTISTLEAMLAGKSDLFRDLKAEPWVQKQSQNPAPVITLDLSGIRIYHSADELNTSLSKELLDIAHEYDINLEEEKYASDYLIQLLAKLSKINQVVLLIDEYDAPIINNLHDKNNVKSYIEILRNFYRIIKANQEYLRFVFITGISTFTKTIMGYAMNNLHDISLDLDYGSIVGFTQDELEEYFSLYIDHCCKRMEIQNTQELYTKIKNYYDGYSFDGKTRVYNPFAILKFLQKCYFADYWYESGSQTFLVNYFKMHHIQSPKIFIKTTINRDDLCAYDIEQITAASFLLQAGYLTITERKDNVLILDFPNQEVLNSISRLYLSEIYNIKEYHNLSKQMWQAIEAGDLKLLITCYNTALSNLPYSDFVNLNEYVYRSLLLMLLRCNEIHGFG